MVHDQNLYNIMNLLKNDGGLSTATNQISNIELIGLRDINTTPISQHLSIRTAMPYIVIGGDINGNE